MKDEDVTKYPKINTLWKRDEDNRYCIMPGDFSCPEFANVKKWHVTEKIDGTNIRIFWDGKTVRFGGRTLNAQIPTHLLSYLMDTFTAELMSEVFPNIEDENALVILYGEGYGVKIQKGGGAYRKDVAFIMFDVKVGEWWLKREDVSEIANKLNIEEVPSIGLLSIEQIVGLVEAEFTSKVETADDDKISEGVVVRSHPLMLFRNGDPIMFKLKVEDFRKLKKFTKEEEK